MYKSVGLGHRINCGELEKILLKAAQDVGLTAIPKDYHSEEYKIRDDGTVYEGQVYQGTTISLRKGILPMIGIDFFNRDTAGFFFGIRTGLTVLVTPNTGELKIYFGSRRLVQEYLKAVSQRLQNVKTKDIERISA